jgi:hypothetical protein
MSKDLFLQMREQEVITNNFLPNKKEIQRSALMFAKNIVDFGEDNIQERYAEIRRLKEAVDVIEAHFKNSLPDEKFEAFGVKGQFRNGGSVANYDDDIVYSQIKKQLDNRKTLLEAALKTDETIYDSEGVEVPKVSKTERKSSLAITF